MKTKISLLTGICISALYSIQVFAAERIAIEKTLDISAKEKIEIKVRTGDVTIKTSNEDTFSVEGYLDERADGFELESNNGFTQFEMKIPRRTKDDDDYALADLTFIIPTGSHLEFSGVNVNVDTDGVAGSADISTVNGDIKANNLMSKITLSTVNGSVALSNSEGKITLSAVNGKLSDKNSSGRVNYEVVNGDIDAESKAKEVVVETVNGDAELILSDTEELEISTVNGDIEIDLSNIAAPDIDGSSVSGDITLKLPEKLSASISISAMAGGDIDNEFTNDKPKRAKFGPTKSLSFTVGDGDGSIELSTVSGALTLEKQ